MKKILYIVILLITTSCILSSAVILKTKKGDKEIGWINESIEDSIVWQSINFNFFRYRISDKYFYSSIEETATIFIPEISIDYENEEKFYNGQFLKKGTIVNGYTLEEDVRIKRIDGNKLLCDLINETYIYVPYYDKINADSTYDVTFSWNSSNYQVSYLSSFFDKEDKIYYIKFSIRNSDGYFIDGMKGRIKGIIRNSYDGEGYLVPKNYFYYDEKGIYTMKYFYDINDREEMYTKIYVKIISQKDDFYVIDTEELKDGNYIIERVQDN